MSYSAVTDDGFMGTLTHDQILLAGKGGVNNAPRLPDKKFDTEVMGGTGNAA